MESNLHTRRKFNALLAACGGGALTTRGVMAQQVRGKDSDESPDSAIDRYKTAEKRLFETCNVRGRSRYVALAKPPIRLRVFEGGQGEPLVMIHGGGATLAEFAPLLGLLEKDFHIYAPDRPGCGLSQMIDYSGVPIRQQALDCVSGLFDQLGLKRAAVAGCSIGGYWGLVFALAAPERVSKLVLLGGPAAPAPHWPERNPPPRSEQPRPTLASTRAGYRFLMANADRASQEMMETMLAAAEIPGAALAWDTLTSAARKQFPVPLSYALRPELKSLKVPALFIMGDKDMEGPPTLAEEMAALAPDGRFELVRDSGHVIWLDQPEIVAEKTRDFLISR